MNKKTEKQASAPEKKYWSSMDEYHGIPGEPEEKFEKEHKASVLEMFDPAIAEAKASRRDFLKLFGFSVTSAALAASCERPVQKAIPYVIQPEEIIPGKSMHYASTFYDGKDYCSILVKSREGRPIKIEGNSLSAFNGGGTTARVQASLLSLYDDARYKQPARNGKGISWQQADEEISRKLSETDTSGKEIILLTSTVISPSTIALIKEFGSRYKNFRWLQYDAISCSAIREAHKSLYGKAIIPDYRFDRSDVIVSFGADFLGTWLAPVHFIPMYAKRKRLHNGEKNMLRHYQLEAGFSLTGSNADHRIPVSPGDEKAILLNLYNTIAAKLGKTQLSSSPSPVNTESIAGELISAGNRGLVLSGSNDPQCQMLVSAINEILGAVGTTVELNAPLNLAAGNDPEMEELITTLKAGKAGAVLLYDVNPVYDYPGGQELKESLAKTELSVSMSWIKNETAEACQFICPTDHYLESWGDAEIIPGMLSLCQPLMHPMFDTRSFQNTLSTWAGKEDSYHEILKAFWKQNYWDGSGKYDDFWSKCLQDGVLNREIPGKEKLNYDPASLDVISISSSSGGFSLCLAESVQMGDGKYANNPWLQELPDPIAKICWDNFLAVSPSDAAEMGVRNGDLVKVNDLVELPVLIQPGQAKSTASVSLGYGRESAGKVGDKLGVNAFPMVQVQEGRRKYFRENVKIEPTGKNIILAFTQTHNSAEGRPIVREATLEEYLESPDAGNEMHAEIESHHRTLYPDMEFDGFHWGLAVDMNACVGCSACMIGCQAENNIPVVGKDEVYRRRIMHWIKIDRYYSDDPENPKVIYQPNMCQHCDNAPCENVCPVSATNHSSEGLNQMSYNRCIGTKYCINNCPYRARRFNWYKYINNDEFDYNTHSDLGRLVLNPDVTVRSRGVVEKCSFCVQRIQEKKLQAKLENRSLQDGEIQPACAQACPAGALVFGNLKDKNSQVSRMFADSRNYHLLEELHTLPSVGYLTKIRNERNS
ncbi:MAG: TAT-variant-translocated molybdopterin oxidoreductase [Bacteroidales bacterium]|nr:TAT-variant-translocated molybdopterin oxidoreductase [Bacteroidales bacterium]